MKLLGLLANCVSFQRRDSVDVDAIVSIWSARLIDLSFEDIKSAIDRYSMTEEWWPRSISTLRAYIEQHALDQRALAAPESFIMRLVRLDLYDCIRGGGVPVHLQVERMARRMTDDELRSALQEFQRTGRLPKQDA